MEWKIIMLLNALKTKHRYYKKGVKERLELLQESMTIKKGKSYDFSNMEISMVPSLPVNLWEVIKGIVDGKEVLPLEFLYTWIPDIKNPEEILQKFEEQKQREAERNLTPIGSPDNFEGEGND
jgi:SPP1 family phage portal protein